LSPGQLSEEEIMSERITETTSRVTREQQAVAELGVTGYSRGVGEALVIMFLLTLAAVPAYETISDVRANTATRRQMLSEGVDIAKLPGRRPRSLDILNLVPSWQQVTSARSVQDWIELLPKPLSIRQYENSLVLNSRAGELIRPTVQWILTGWLGTGHGTRFHQPRSVLPWTHRRRPAQGDRAASRRAETDGHYPGHFSDPRQGDDPTGILFRPCEASVARDPEPLLERLQQ
jgi:hypothetical protein